MVSTRGVVTKPKKDLVAAGIGDMPSLFGVDIGLLACLGGWFLGNYYYTLNNKLALNAAAGGAPGGFPMTIGFMQFVIGSIYALFLWAAPDSRAFPTVTMSDVTKILPVAACAAGALRARRGMCWSRARPCALAVTIIIARAIIVARLPPSPRLTYLTRAPSSSR